MGKRGRPRYPDVLTPREQEVLALLQEGLTNEQIASRLDVSPATAKYHVSEILSKLGVGTREEAAAWAPEAEGEGWTWRRWVMVGLGTAVVVGAVGVLGLLAWGVWETGDGGDGGQAVGATDGPREPTARVSPTSSPVTTPIPEEFAYGAFPWRKSLYALDPATGAADIFLADIPHVMDWSPDGAELAYVRRYDDLTVHFADPSGQSTSSFQVDTFETIGGLAWSPTGEYLMLSGETITQGQFGDELRNTFAVIRREDGKVHFHFRPPLSTSVNLHQWMPDGQAIFFELHTSGDDLSNYRTVMVDLNGETELSMPGPAGVVSPDGRHRVVNESPLMVIPFDKPSGIDAFSAPLITSVWSPDSQRLAYRATDGVHVVNRDLTNDRLLTQGNAWAWSGDGSELAVIREGDIWLVNTDGTGERQLTAIPFPFASAPTWSPDGRVMFSYAHHFPEILVADSDGTDKTRLVPGSTPRWSPDGKRIAFVSGSAGIGGVGGNIFTMAPDGSDIVRLPAEIFHGDVSPGPCANRDLAWSPDGQHIYYCNKGIYRVAAVGQSEAEKIVEGFSFDVSSTELLVYSRSDEIGDGQSAIRIHDLTTGQDFAVTRGSWPSWSSDGRFISFERNHTRPVDSGIQVFSTSSLYVWDTLTATERLVHIFENPSGLDAAWSPVAPVLAFSAYPNVYTVDLTSQAARSRAGVGQSPMWSPDGTKLILIEGVSNETLSVADLASGHVAAIGHGFYPAWSPDGLRLTYNRY